MRLLLTISLFFCLLLSLFPAYGESVRLLVQSSPLAGSQYYAAGELWQEMRVGDALALIREADNRYDPQAIRVEWRGVKLGYVPRAENRSVAQAMDEGQRVSARIARLNEHPNPWKRVEIEIFLHL